MPQLERDEALEKRLLAAVIQEERERPRSQQRTVGPSEIGGCRRLLQAKIFEDGSDWAQETEWPTAAHVGTVMGESLEAIFSKRLGALTQKRITTMLPDLELVIAGSSDVILVDDNVIVDLKSIETIAKLHSDGPKLSHLIQVSIYTLGAVQMGLLEEGATAVLAYYDRSGATQEFVCVTIDADAIARFIELAQERLRDVLAAQEALEAGDPTPTHELRDQAPSFCFSKKVQCPLRFKCWGGSSWDPSQNIFDEAVYEIAKRYITGRDMEQAGKALKTSAKTELEGIEGHVFGSGGEIIVGKDGRGYISVVAATDKGK